MERFGDSEVNGIFEQIDENGTVLSPYNLRDTYWDTRVLRQRGIESTLNVIPTGSILS